MKKIENREYANIRFSVQYKEILKKRGLIMQPEKLKYLDRIQKFINVLVESAKTDKINEMEFYMLLSTQCKAKSKILHYQKRG
jgi:hypothetical protein